MALTQDQVNELKDQLRKQVESLPVTQKEAALKQIDEMSDEALESMINQQKDSQEGQSSKPQKGVFRLIIDGDIPSKKIHENDYAVAVVSVRPISKGHILIIPKKPSPDEKALPNLAMELAKEISQDMTKKLNAKSVEILPQFLFDEIVINLIPIYDKPLTTSSPSYEATQEEIEEIFNLLKFIPKISTKPKLIKIKKKKAKATKVLKLNRRIP